MPRDEARLAARRAFGGVEQAKEHQRDARGFRWLDNSRMDFKLGARMLAKYPALSLIGGVGQAVGVAIGAGFFAFLFLPRTPRCRSRAVSASWHSRTGTSTSNNEMRQSMHDPGDVAARDEDGRGNRRVSHHRAQRDLPGGSAEPFQIAQVTAVGFNITRVTPVIGRAIVEADESAGALADRGHRLRRVALAIRR